MGIRYDLITIDLDGTISRVITEEYVLKRLAPERLEKYYEFEKLLRDNFELNYEKATTEQFKLLIGLKAIDIINTIKEIPLAKNIENAIDRLRKYGFRVMILTDNIDLFCDGVREKVPIDGYISSKTMVIDGIIRDLSELNLRKEIGLKKYLEKNNLSPERVIHIGDWKNDIPVFDYVGLGIAYMPKDNEVIENAHLTINIEDFDILAKLIIKLDSC